jgi:hypothetical protein
VRVFWGPNVGIFRSLKVGCVAWSLRHFGDLPPVSRRRLNSQGDFKCSGVARNCTLEPSEFIVSALSGGVDSRKWMNAFAPAPGVDSSSWMGVVDGVCRQSDLSLHLNICLLKEPG